MSSSLTTTQSHRHLLRLILSTRKITAQVTNSTTSTIIAMASSSEHDFLSHYHSKLNRFPGTRRFWDSTTASSVGDKLGLRLREIGVDNVAIDLNEELSRPVRQRIVVSPLFDSLRRAGVIVDGADRLKERGPVSGKMDG